MLRLAFPAQIKWQISCDCATCSNSSAWLLILVAIRPAVSAWKDQLFPSLLVTRLEERRLLKTLCRGCRTRAPQRRAAPNRTVVPGHDVAGSDIETLAVTMYGGPTHGDFTPEMQQLTHGGSNGGSHGIDKPDAHDDKNGAASLGPITTTATMQLDIQRQSGRGQQPGRGRYNSRYESAAGECRSRPAIDQRRYGPCRCTGLSVADPASGTNPITTQFTVTHGTLSVDTTGGVPQPSGAILLPNGVVITGNGTNSADNPRHADADQQRTVAGAELSSDRALQRQRPADDDVE